jgi:hypothetical protein
MCLEFNFLQVLGEDTKYIFFLNFNFHFIFLHFLIRECLNSLRLNFR